MNKDSLCRQSHHHQKQVNATVDYWIGAGPGTGPGAGFGARPVTPHRGIGLTADGSTVLTWSVKLVAAHHTPTT